MPTPRRKTGCTIWRRKWGRGLRFREGPFVSRKDTSFEWLAGWHRRWRMPNWSHLSWFSDDTVTRAYYMLNFEEDLRGAVLNVPVSWVVWCDRAIRRTNKHYNSCSVRVSGSSAALRSWCLLIKSVFLDSELGIISLAEPLLWSWIIPTYLHVLGYTIPYHNVSVIRIYENTRRMCRQTVQRYFQFGLGKNNLYTYAAVTCLQAVFDSALFFHLRVRGVKVYTWTILSDTEW